MKSLFRWVNERSYALDQSRSLSLTLENSKTVRSRTDQDRFIVHKHQITVMLGLWTG